MKVHYLFHADFERPGIIEKWAKENHIQESFSAPFAGDSIPSPDEFDLLIIMGGPQSPLSIEKASYLKDEIQLIEETIANEIPILGFCLGAQLIGEALGAKTERSPEKEIGVFSVTLTEEGKKDRLFQNFPSSFPALHWHNDMPGVTREAKVIAYSEGCPRQIIRYLPFVYGFQCHLGPTRENIKDMIVNCPEDVASKGRFIQSQEELLSQDFTGMNQLLLLFLEQLSFHIQKQPV